MTLFKASFDESDTVHGELSDEALIAMLSAQATWDASMGWNAVQALRQQQSPNPIVVVLAGSGHVAYGLGIERQARQWFDGPIASLIAVPVRDDEDRPVRQVRASYANFVWGVPAEASEAFPSLGASTRLADGSEGLRRIIQVDKKSVAARAGLSVGDVIVSVDGVSARDTDTLNRLIAAKNWGDTATFVIRRGDQERTLTVVFRRAGKDEEPEK